MITLPDVLKMCSDGTLVAIQKRKFSLQAYSAYYVNIMMLCVVSYRKIIYRNILWQHYKECMRTSLEPVGAASGSNCGATAEADTIGEQQLNWMRLVSSSSAYRELADAGLLT